MINVEMVLSDELRQEIVATCHMAVSEALQADKNPIRSKAKTAEMFGISTGTLMNWVKEGLPMINPAGGRVFFNYYDVIAFLEDRKS